MEMTAIWGSLLVIFHPFLLRNRPPHERHKQLQRKGAESDEFYHTFQPKATTKYSLQAGTDA